MFVVVYVWVFFCCYFVAILFSFCFCFFLLQLFWDMLLFFVCLGVCCFLEGVGEG